MRALFLLLILSLFSSKMFARSSYFDFTTDGRHLDLAGEIKVDLSYELVGVEDSRFRLRPISVQGAVEILSGEAEGWIPGNVHWSDLPSLDKKAGLRFVGEGFFVTKVYFQIQDMLTTTIYETPKRRIWSRRWFSVYVEKLNENILRMVEYSNGDI